MSKLNQDRYRELAHFLRNRRSRVTPKQVGLPETARRRTLGLRRGEVAMLAGVSLEWYTYLEQGRHIQVSAELLENLSMVLQLDEVERRHLFLLARNQEPPIGFDIQTKVPAELLSLLNALGTSPGCITDARMNILAWNASFSTVFGEFEHKSERERNLVWVTFVSEDFRSLLGEEWKDHAHRVIAQFRTNYAQFVNDPWWTEQIEALSESSQFRALWDLHDVINAPNIRKTFHHPEAGVLVFDYISLLPPSTMNLLVSIYVPQNDQQTVQKIQQLLGKR
jgi:transcriptional regulator with XRE-family HTH domain